LPFASLTQPCLLLRSKHIPETHNLLIQSNFPDNNPVVNILLPIPFAVFLRRLRELVHFQTETLRQALSPAKHPTGSTRKFPNLSYLSQHQSEASVRGANTLLWEGLSLGRRTRRRTRKPPQLSQLLGKNLLLLQHQQTHRSLLNSQWMVLLLFQKRFLSPRPQTRLRHHQLAFFM